jgi:hypothetical protein
VNRRIFGATLVAAFAITVIGGPALAGPPEFKNGADVQKKDLFVVNTCSSDAISTTPTGGSVVLVTPPGEQVLNVNGSAVGLAPNSAYDVWMRDLDPGFSGDYIFHYAPLGYYKLVTFMTDASGAGTFQVGFKTADLDQGTYNMQVALNNSGAANFIGCTYQATVNNILVVID